MKALLIKDFKLMKNQKNFFIILLLLVISMIFFSNDMTFTMALPTFVLTMFAISSISYDDMDNGYAFLFTLPVTRKKYVIEKYLFGVLLAISALLISGLLNFIAILMKNPNNVSEIAMIILSLIPVIFTLLAVIIPIQFKFGAEKARLALFLIFGGVSILALILEKLASTVNINFTDLEIVMFFEKTPILIVQILVVLGSLLICFISIKISQKIVMGKEF